VCRDSCATAFPGALGLAATFNRSVWWNKGDVISTEMRALYNSGGKRKCEECYVGLTGFGPNINIARDPRFGRTSELPSEDPYLNGEYAIQYIQAMQQVDSNGYQKMLAFLKHFTAYSREENRGSDTYNISTFDYFDTYLPAFEMGMKQGRAAGVMCSYNGENGHPSCANSYLLNDILRTKWNRPDSIVMTDCGSVSFLLHKPANAPSPIHAAAWAIMNGSDVEAGTHLWVDNLTAAVEQELVEETAIDTALRRAFMAMMKVGRFDDPDQVVWSSITEDAIGSPQHTQIRDDAARQASVLLRNLGGALPLEEVNETVVVVGPQATNVYGYLPDYFGDEVCPDDEDPYKCISTVYDSVRNYNADGQTFVFPGILENTPIKAESYDEALTAVENLADVVILSMGISRASEREGVDRTQTTLPGLQNQFALDVLAIAAIKDIPAVLLLTNGGALSIDELLPIRDYSTVYDATKPQRKLSSTQDDSSHQEGISLSKTYKSRSRNVRGTTGQMLRKFPRKYAIIEAYNPSLGMQSVVEAMFGIGPISWGRLVTTMYPQNWSETHQSDQYDLSAGDGLTYRYYRGEALAVFGEGMPSEDPHEQQFKCSLQQNITLTHQWTITCTMANRATRPFAALLMVYVRASDKVHVNAPYPVPLRALRNFERFMVEPKDDHTIRFELSLEDLMLVNNEGHKEALSGRHFDIIDVWDGWDGFASFRLENVVTTGNVMGTETTEVKR